MNQPGCVSLDMDYLVRAVLAHPEFQAALGKPKEEDSSWLDKNPEAKASVMRGIEQARNFQFVDPPPEFVDGMGECFAPYSEAVEYARAVQDRFPKRNPSLILEWTENRPSDEECGYDHCSAETPFGRFRITWKSWKIADWPSVDETPWGDWYSAFPSVEQAKLACQEQFDIRLALCFPSWEP